MNARPRFIPPKTRRPARRGISMLEIIVTSLLLGAVISAIVPVLSACAAHHRTSDLRRCGMQELSNALERMSLAPYEKLDDAARGPFELSPPARRQIPDGKVTVNVSDPTGEPRGRRITAELRWSSPGGPSEPLRLSTWRFAEGRVE
jgi:Tfp pilus assembly protein PilV